MIDDRAPDPKLVLRAETLARDLPFREPDFDALALRVASELSEAEPGDALLLSAPLPETDEEKRALAESQASAESPASADLPASTESPASSEGVPARRIEPPRESVSLAELARATVAKRAGGEVKNIAKESLALASQKRAQLERATPAREPVAPQVAPAASAPRTSRSAGDSRGPWIGVAVAAVGLAAGFGLYLAGQRPATLVQVPAPPADTASVAAATVPPAAPVPAREFEARAAEGSQPKGEVMAEPEPASSARTESPPALAAAPADAVAKAAGKQTGAATLGGSSVRPEKIVLDEDERAGASPARTAKPAENGELRPAELTPSGTIADRPTAGAAQAAVGAVLGAARACLAGQAKPSSVTLVFGSNGQVSSVSVGEPAAGTPAAACVEGALKKARVQPFAAPSFSLGVTVRPP